jgi:vacuolar-type H+-ATPase subunit H
MLCCVLCLDQPHRRRRQVDENVVEEIRLHQETIAVDNNSPLHLIREKELAISGRVLSAKREADEIVTSARKKAAEVVSTAEAEGGAGAAGREKVIREEAVREANSLREAAHAESSRLKEEVEARREQATRLVLDAVTTV